LSQEDIAEIRKWAGRRRAFGLLGALNLAFIGAGFAEMDHMTYTVDDFALAVLGVVVLLIYLAGRNKTSVGDMKRHTNIFFAILFVASIIKVAWLFIEMGDVDAVGDDMSVWFFLAATIANRVL
jgi:apolipoprotein N-acyltransferase